MNDITRKALSGMSGDGFNERKTYINRNNDLNSNKKNIDFDQSLSKLRIQENKPDIKTVEDNKNFNLQTLDRNDTSKLKNNVDMYLNFKRQNMNKFK